MIPAMRFFTLALRFDVDGSPAPSPPEGSVADRCKYLLHIHLTFNVRGHWDEFAVAIRAPWCRGSGHGSPSFTS